MKCYQWKKTAIECSLDQIIRTDLPMLVITTDEEIKADPHLDQMLPEGSKIEKASVMPKTTPDIFQVI